MMQKQIKHVLKTMGMTMGLSLSIVSFGYSGDIDFQESASDVMISSLSTEPPGSFLKQLYTELFFVPVWIGEKAVSALATELFGLIRSDETLEHNTQLYMDALRLEEYAKGLYAHEDISIAGKVDLEFKLARLYKDYADYILYGSINWGAFEAQLYNLRAEGITANWVTNKPESSPVSVLESAVLSGSLYQAFEKVEPKDYHYGALKKELLRYLEIKKQGGWESIPFSQTIRPKSHSSSIPLIRARLEKSGEIGCPDEGEYYDSCLQEAVMVFQHRHGLNADGAIGKQTIEALNIPVSQKVAMIRLNLDRIKWLIHRDTLRQITINIPAFTLYFEEDQKLYQQMKVITGKRHNPTPVFSNVVQYIVLNPYWNVPKSIVQKEMIPKLLRNPGAMRKEGIDVYAGWGNDAQKINPATVNWSQYRYSKSVPFRFAQPPGYKNALGKLKFLFPNQFSVYMHDTPTKPLFNRDVRAFSHGCIRLEQPRELLKTFSTFNNNVNFEKAQERLKGSKLEYIKLESQVPIDVVYLTAWVDYSGTLQFRDDIYGYDEMQLAALRKW